MHKTKLIILPEAYWFFCVCLLLLPLKFVAAWLISVIVHEGSHYLALKACRCPVPVIKIGMLGAQMETGELSDKCEALCAAAGPVGGLLMLIFIKIFPLVTVISLLHSLFNLIPLFPSDGGRIVHCLINRLFKDPQKAKFIFDNIMIILLMGLAIYGFIELSFGIIPLGMIIFTAVKRRNKIFLQT